MAESAQTNEEPSSNTWFADIMGDGSQMGDQLQAIKNFAYIAFDKIDKDGNGFLSQVELEALLASGELGKREQSFLTFLLDNHDQIAEATDEGEHADGISRYDLEAYFDLIATLL